MKLTIEGHKYRTSGSGEPFDTFSLRYEDLASLLGQEVALPLPEAHFKVTELLGGGAKIALSIDDGQAKIFDLKTEETIRLERGILGVEIHFRLSE